jgi:hypothetical protein
LQAQYVAANGSSFLQVEHRFQKRTSAPIASPAYRATSPSRARTSSGSSSKS